MRRYSLTYFLGQSVKGLWRNGVMSMASITVLLSCLVVMGSFSLLVYNINYNVEQIGTLNEIKLFVDTALSASADSGSDSNDDTNGADTTADATDTDITAGDVTYAEPTPESEALTAELNEKIAALGAFKTFEETGTLMQEIASGLQTLAQTGVDTSSVQNWYTQLQTRITGLGEIRDKLQSLDNVASVTLVTKQSAFEQQREKYADYQELFDSLSENPYPDAFVITYQDNASISSLEYQLNHLDERIYKVSSDTSVAETIEGLKNIVVMIFSWFLAILFIVSLFVIINTIKLAVFSRRQEISIMRYVGATNWFITVPFLFEGIIIGLLSSGFAFLMQYYIYSYIARMIVGFPILTVIPFSSVSGYVALSFVGVGVLTGIIGSSFSLHRYMRA